MLCGWWWYIHGCIHGAKLTEVYWLHMCGLYLNRAGKKEETRNHNTSSERTQPPPLSPLLPPPWTVSCPHSCATQPSRGTGLSLAPTQLLLLTSPRPVSVLDHSIHSQTQGEAACLNRTEQDLFSPDGVLLCLSS